MCVRYTELIFYDTQSSAMLACQQYVLTHRDPHIKSISRSINFLTSSLFFLTRDICFFFFISFFFSFFFLFFGGVFVLCVLSISIYIKTPKDTVSTTVRSISTATTEPPPSISPTPIQIRQHACAHAHSHTHLSLIHI